MANRNEKLKDYRIPEIALARARQIGIKAAKEDTWMQPNATKFPKDYGEFQQEHRAGWEQTDHFTLGYRQQLEAIGYAEADAADITPQNTDEFGLAITELIFDPLLDAFWEAWEEKVDLLGYYKRKREEKENKPRHFRFETSAYMIDISCAKGVASLDSDLAHTTNDGEPIKAWSDYDHAIDGIESLLLAMAAAGIDLDTDQMREAVDQAIHSITSSKAP